MANIECPRCQQETISRKDKIKTGKWLNIYCDNCGARLCANPIVLALMWGILLWDIFFFGFMAVYEQSWIYFTIMLVGWAIMEFFIFYVPLSIMKPKAKPTDHG